MLFVGQLVKRHAGVLGLAALVEACPYTVPEWLPSVLDHISDHLRDPAPIQVLKVFVATIYIAIGYFLLKHVF